MYPTDDFLVVSDSSLYFDDTISYMLLVLLSAVTHTSHINDIGIRRSRSTILYLVISNFYINQLHLNHYSSHNFLLSPRLPHAPKLIAVSVFSCFIRYFASLSLSLSILTHAHKISHSHLQSPTC